MFEQCLYFNTTALSRRLEREWAQAFAPFDLTPPQAFMLRAILNQPGMLQNQLSHTLAIARPTATRALDTLEVKRFVERRRMQGDGREVAIWPTPQAVGIQADLNRASGVVTARLKKHLSPVVFSDTVTLLQSVRSALD